MKLPLPAAWGTPVSDMTKLIDTLTQEKQDYGKNPISIRKTSKYQTEYIGSFVDKWDELIDWEARSMSEGDFFIEQLKQRGCKRILDVAAGTGFHTVRLLNEGFEVVCADGSPVMLAKAFENGLNHNHILRTVQADWRWLNKDIHGKFDAVICLGNSFTHLHSERDRRKSLAEFYAKLNYDGILILDQRNYDSILDNGFSSKHAYYYCGDKVKAEPEHVDDGLARFAYTFPDGSKYHLNMFPLRKAYVEKLMLEVGFQTVNTYADFQETYKTDDPDFYIHIAEKEYVMDPETSTEGARS
jgi:SAM-dependent methyltransferase